MHNMTPPPYSDGALKRLGEWRYLAQREIKRRSGRPLATLPASLPSTEGTLRLSPPPLELRTGLQYRRVGGYPSSRIRLGEQSYITSRAMLYYFSGEVILLSAKSYIIFL